MQYLPLFLLLAAVLIAAYFYVQRAKRRDAGTNVDRTSEPSQPAAAPGEPTTGRSATDDRPR